MILPASETLPFRFASDLRLAQASAQGKHKHSPRTESITRNINAIKQRWQIFTEMKYSLRNKGN